MKLRPNDIENCDMGPCAKSWFLTEWSDRVRLGIFIPLNQEFAQAKQSSLAYKKNTKLST